MLFPQKSPPALQSTSVSYSMTTKEGRRQYKSNPLQCASCSLLAPCTKSKNHWKIIERPIWALHVEEADHLRQHSDTKQIYARRNRTIVHVFTDGKEEHGMRWTTLRGIKKIFKRKKTGDKLNF